jgi:hypothetical protein
VIALVSLNTRISGLSVLAFSFIQLIGDAPGISLVTTHAGHPSPFRGQAHGNGLTNPPPCAGDDCILILKSHRALLHAIETISARARLIRNGRVNQQRAAAWCDSTIPGLKSQRSKSSNENKMSDGGRERASLGMDVWK